MFYTIMPTDTLLYDEKQQKEYAYEEFSLKDCTIQLYKTGTDYKVKRIISTDPSVYLKAEYQPDTILTKTKLDSLK